MIFCPNECISAGSGEGEARGGRSMRDTRHAARTRLYASRPSGTASKLFGGKLPSTITAGYLRG